MVKGVSEQRPKWGKKGQYASRPHHAYFRGRADLQQRGTEHSDKHAITRTHARHLENACMHRGMLPEHTQNSVMA